MEVLLAMIVRGTSRQLRSKQDQIMEIITSAWLMPVVAIATLVVAIVASSVAVMAWRKPKTQVSATFDPKGLPKLYGAKDTATVHATSGAPSLQQLTTGTELDARAQGLAENLYELGRQQYDHPVNNRDGAIDLARREMSLLARELSHQERKLAEQVGMALANEDEQSDREKAEAQYRGLSPTAKIYAQHKRSESEAQETIARDLEKRVPRTDYTSVKQRIASGEADLGSVITEFPIMWQSIRTLNDKVGRPKLVEKPPKPEKFHVEFCMADGRLLQDKRAERDGDWLVSHKHGFLVPCPPPTRIWKFNGQGRTVPTGKSVLIVNRDPSSEWETEFWRRGGHMDQTYLKAVAGRLPHQLRKAYRQRQIRRAQWCVVGILWVVNIVLFLVNNL